MFGVYSYNYYALIIESRSCKLQIQRSEQKELSIYINNLNLLDALEISLPYTKSIGLKYFMIVTVFNKLLRVIKI